jgi:hypothetical protein
MEDFDDTTRADPPGVVLRRLAEHQRALCAAFDQAAGRIDELPARDQLAVLGLLDKLCEEWVAAVGDTGQQVKELHALAAVFRPRSKTPPGR